MSHHYENYGGLASRWGALAAEIDSDEYESEEEYSRGGVATGAVPIALRAWTRKVARERTRLQRHAKSPAAAKKITLKKVMLSLAKRSKSKSKARSKARR